MPIEIKSYSDVKLVKSKMYFVSILSDGYISWEFCMRILTTVFHKNDEDANAIANEIVTNGEGFCGGYAFEIAETKAVMVEEQAKKERFSLLCLVEEV